MARRNGIWYEGRLINNREQCKLSRARTGKLVLDLVVAEQFQERNDRAPDKYKDATKPADAYVNTETAWHKVRIFGEEAELRPLTTSPLFNHNAVVVVDASYRQEANWTDRGGVTREGRRENIFMGGEDGGSVQIKVLDDGRTFGARDEWAKPLWDGVSDLPALGGSGGGGPVAPQYADDEGF